ncbi:hypothetical protein D0T26_01045 [Duganella sp. BJB489]|nr:hypothetical protein D0T26_01045 [Duganella sp. BJB489]
MAMVSAYAIAKERDLFHRGDPTGKIYYSLHSPGRREPMSHVYRRGTAPHFKFINPADEHVSGPGESLEHLLFKEAVSSISGTTLKLGKMGDHRVTVIHSEVEKEIKHTGAPRRADVYLRFESQTALGFKWGNEVYIEIRHTHAVEKEKLDIVKQLRLPMVEVTIHPNILYEYTGEQTTDEREAAYVKRIKNMLEGATGFLACEVLNNPSTAPYLEMELSHTQKKLTLAEGERLAAEKNHSDLSIETNRLTQELRITSQNLAVARDHANACMISTNEAAAKNQQLLQQLKQNNLELESYRASQNRWLVDARIVCGCLIGVALLLYLYYQLTG